MIKRLGYLLVLMCVLWVIALFGYAHYIMRLDAETRKYIATQPVNAIVVLTGGTQRIAEGVRLLQQGKAEHLFISGVGKGVQLHQIIPNLAEDLQSKITLGRNAHDTASNAQEVYDWIMLRGLSLDQNVLLVTAHYHLPRALWHLSEKIPTIDWLPYAVEPNAFTLDRWYQFVVGWRLMSIELLKFLVKGLR